MTGSTQTRVYPADNPLRWLLFPLRALACVGVGALYLVVIFLTKVAPRRSASERAKAMPQSRAARGSRLIRWSVWLYRFSLVNRHFNRTGGRCMFLPSCSEYALLAGEKHGLRRGLMVIGDRFRRCRADTCEDYLDFP